MTNCVDRHIGGRLRKRRVALDLCEAELALRLRITIAQVRAFEAGRARIGAAMLAALCAALDTPVAYFFEEFISGRSGPS